MYQVKKVPKSLPKLLQWTENDGRPYQWLFHRHLSVVAQWNQTINLDGQQNHGSIFNLEFSQDGRTLVCACENKSILLFDPYSYKKINSILNAHNDCVNCIRFIDTRTFASCSDDKTISLWDIRKLNGVLTKLKGHSSWVKSIEYDKISGLLLSSAFDDTVKLWDINSYSTDGTFSSKIALTLPSLVRSKFSTDFSKLFLTTRSGLGIIAIHDVDMERISQDCESLDLLIKTEDERAMKRCVNRVEKINEFPAKRKPGCIYSIDVHPYGWCILARYSNRNGRSEYTCVYDVQDYHTGGCNNECCHAYSSLTHFIDEPNVGRGFIKELCFNSDGRLICSPFGNGVRLLAFDRNCSELSDCVPDKPSQLKEIKTLVGHKSTVFTAKCSPCMLLLATGCLDGSVSFHLPKL